MTKDLTPGQEKPLWPLTSYGPAKHQPPLIGGLEESFEELRVRAVTAVKSGTTNDYVRSSCF
jgi:nucleoporin NUP42